MMNENLNPENTNYSNEELEVEKNYVRSLLMILLGKSKL